MSKKNAYNGLEIFNWTGVGFGQQSKKVFHVARVDLIARQILIGYIFFKRHLMQHHYHNNDSRANNALFDFHHGRQCPYSDNLRVPISTERHHAIPVCHDSWQTNSLVFCDSQLWFWPALGILQQLVSYFVVYLPNQIFSRKMFNIQMMSKKKS